MVEDYDFFGYFQEFDRHDVYDIYRIYYEFYPKIWGDGVASSIQRNIDNGVIRNLTEPDLKTILGAADLNVSEVLNIFKYGSMVYGTQTNKSDFDHIVVSNNVSKEVNIHNINIKIVSLDIFKEAIDNCEIWALECLNLPEQHIIYNIKSYPHSIDKTKLRRYVSEKSSHSFVKAKKKFIVEKDKDIYVGKKSLFHSLRIINFGIQLASVGKINNYGSLNHIHTQIMENTSESWEYYNEVYKPMYNNMMSDFRKLAPKE